MSKLSIILAVALVAGCASTGSWRALRVDASSESSLEQSLASLEQALPYHRSQRFVIAVAHITGSYPPESHYGRLDGLAYDEIIELAGPEADEAYRELRAGNATTATRGLAAKTAPSTFRGFTGVDRPFSNYPGVPRAIHEKL